MGLCYSEPVYNEDSPNWRDYLEAECMQLRTEISWASPLLSHIPDHERNPDPNMTRDMIIITETYRSQHNVSDNKVNFAKVLRRSGLAEEDLCIQTSDQGSSHSTYNNSHLSVTPSFLYQDKHQNGIDIEQRAILNRQVDFFANLTDSIKQHIKKPNEIGLVIEEFQKQYHQNRTEFEIALQEFQQFCRVLQQAIKMYYNLTTLKQQYSDIYYLVNDDSLLNFACGVLLANQVTYQMLYDSLYQTMREKVREHQLLLQQLANISTEQCGIQHDFQLHVQKEPYDKPIKTLKKITSKNAPASKMKIIIRCSKQIISCILNQHKDRGHSLIVSSDDLLPILTYIVIKSQIVDLQVQLVLIERLASNRMLQSTCGYYLTSIQVAIETLKTLKI